ncbi:MAG: hypothetical protein COA58_07035 [Bacteroidetes bacterium]|nr:MAG: hypothetical protein COA58_07035 [Bacteroidota bacterium]
MRLTSFIEKTLFNSVFIQITFWIWNLLFITLWITLEVESGFVHYMIADAISGDMPMNILLISLVLILIPLVSLILALTKLFGIKDAITKWFLCVEIPLMFLCFLRLVGLQELTSGNSHFLLVAVLGIITFIVYILKDTKFFNNKWMELKMMGFTSMLLLVFYFALLASLVVIPAFWILVKAFFSFEWLEIFSHPRDLFFSIIGAVFMGISSVLGVVYPIYAVFTYFKSFKFGFDHFKQSRYIATWLTVILTVSVNVVLFFALNVNQSQHYAFDLWEELEEKDSKPELKNEVRENEVKMKKGIMNAYLARYRYMCDSDDEPLKYMYNEAFGNEFVTSFAKTIFNGLGFPFIYQGDIYNDEDKARELYGNLFDESLHIAEKDRILHAMNSTWNRRRVEAGILDINEKKVLVTHQDVKVKENGNFARIEIHETYKNQTFQQQEILYYFTLPANAVFTGLWLSDNDSIEKQYEYVVSPRGAAQQVYKNEVRRRVDPSLLEQVGPNQYRLRAFPILPKTWEYDGDFRSDRKIKEGENFHLWLEYSVYSDGETWPTPRIIERRNVFQNDYTEHVYQSENMEQDYGTWIPYSLPKLSSPRDVEEMSFDGRCVAFSKSKEPSIKKQKVNVIVDNSYSMSKQIGSIEKGIAEITELLGMENVRTFINNEEFGLLDESMFWGDNQTLTQLYDNKTILNSATCIFLTDNGSYELLTDTLSSLQLKNPLYLVHVNENWPKAYPDNLFETIKLNGGGAVGNIKDLAGKMKKFEYISRHENISSSGGVDIDFYETSKNPCIIGPSSIGSQIIAAKMIDKMVKDVYSENRLAVLDNMHDFAKKNHIVTPYSSMIVLVNERQKKALEDAENQEDRFDRENETGGEPIGKLGLTEVTGTPEPHEWLLMILSTCMLLILWYRKKYKVV